MNNFDQAVLEALSRNSAKVMQVLGEDMVTDVERIFAIHFFKQVDKIIDGKIKHGRVTTRDDRIRKIAIEEAENVFRARIKGMFREELNDD
jgi:hypothetical protein